MTKEVRRLFLLTWILNFGMWTVASTWNSTFESSPANTSALSQGATRIRELKDDVRKRLAVENCFGTGFTGSSTNCTTADNGRLREGAARAFFQDAAPTQIAVDDFLAVNALDDGRLWVDSNNNNQLHIYDSVAGAFEAVSAIPAGLIVMMDDTVTCPTGWTRVDTMTNRFPVGTDTAAANATIPDTSGQTGGTEGHTHTGSTGFEWTSGTGGGFVQSFPPDPEHGHDFTTDSTTHWSPFRTVIFCKKD